MRKAFRSEKKVNFAETAVLTFSSRTAKGISGSGLREGWPAFETVRLSLIHLLTILISSTVGLHMSTRRAAPGSLPLKVGCMFFKMAALNPLQRYQHVMSFIPSVDGQMRCGLDVNAADSPVYDFATVR